MDEITGFLSQPVVPGLVAMACIPAILLIGYVLSVYLRATRRATATIAKSASSNEPSGLDLLNDAREQAQYDLADMPDMDLLAPVAKETPRPKNDLRTITDAPQRLRLHNGAVVKAVEVLTIMRDERDGRLLVQLGDKGYRSLIDSPEAKRDFTRIMKELSGIIMQADTDAPANEPLPEPDFVDSVMPTPKPTPPKPTPVQPPVAPKPTPSIEPSVEKPARPVVKGASLPGDLPSYKFDDNPAVIQPNRWVGAKKIDFTPPPVVDIASAIEKYLQFRLQGSEYEGRNIHVLPALNGGVRIQVDEAYYDFVDEVADEGARSFIKQAIAEWQERQG